jgi:hypothetical protein
MYKHKYERWKEKTFPSSYFLLYLSFHTHSLSYSLLSLVDDHNHADRLRLAGPEIPTRTGHNVRLKVGSTLRHRRAGLSLLSHSLIHSLIPPPFFAGSYSDLALPLLFSLSKHTRANKTAHSGDVEIFIANVNFVILLLFFPLVNCKLYLYREL